MAYPVSGCRGGAGRLESGEGAADGFGLAGDDGEVGQQGAVRHGAALFEVSQAGEVDVIGGGEFRLAELLGGADLAQGRGGLHAGEFDVGEGVEVGLLFGR
jgi:hypothetical protein